MTQRVRVLVVDDSPFVQRAVERMLDRDGIEVVGTASDGIEALEQAHRLAPDVILLDINMPRLDGLAALERIMAEAPTAVLLMSTLTASDAEITMRGLELGAVDFIDKGETASTMDIYDLAPLLRRKVVSAAGAALTREGAGPALVAMEGAPGLDGRRNGADVVRGRPGRVENRAAAFEVVLLGASTGGPRALGRVLPALPADFPVPVVVAQHMPPGFTMTLAARLNGKCALEVREAHDGAPLERGVVLIGQGGRSLRLERRAGGVVVRVGEEQDRRAALPSVDELFASASEAVGGRAIAVVLTGMGEDGAEGLRLLRAAGAATLAESEETAVIYGMPRAARPSALQELPLYRIAPALSALCAGEPLATREG